MECRCIVGEGWQEEDGISISEMIDRLKTFSYEIMSSSFCLSFFFFWEKNVRAKFIDDVKAVKMDGKLSIFGNQIAKISETDWHLNKTLIIFVTYHLIYI